MVDNIKPGYIFRTDLTGKIYNPSKNKKASFKFCFGNWIRKNKVLLCTNVLSVEIGFFLGWIYFWLQIINRQG